MVIKVFEAYKQESTVREWLSRMINKYIISAMVDFTYHKLVTNSKLLVYAELNGIKWKISE